MSVHISSAYPARGITFDAPGRPPVQGSFRPVKSRDGRVFLKPSSGDRNAEFRADLAEAVRRLEAWEPITSACTLHLEVRLARPRNQYRTGKRSSELRDDAPRRPTRKPDVDKVVRAVNDALTAAGVWGDDALVSSLHVRKCWAGVEPEGLSVQVRVWEDQ